VRFPSPTGEENQSGLSGKVSLLHNGRKIVTLWQGSYEAPQFPSKRKQSWMAYPDRDNVCLFLAHSVS
jgi:hypothetical protein